MSDQPATGRRFRIGIASSGLGRIFRGVEAWAADLAEALHDRGEQVVLFKGGGRAERPYERLVPCLEQGSDAIRRFRRCLPRGAWRLGLGSEVQVEQTTFAVNLIPELRRHKIDVLHVQDAQVVVVTQWAKRLGLIRTPTVLGHGTEESLEYLKKIRYLQHLAPWHLEQARAAGAWRPTWTALPNFIDTDLFSHGRADGLRAELGIPADDLVVLTAAAVKRHHKRIDHLLDEFARLRADRPDLPVTLVVAGAGTSDTPELVASGTARLGDRVRFLVNFPRARMPELYRTADLFVLCSLFEMMPIAVLEAGASGLPGLVHEHPVLEWMTGPGGRRVDMAVAGRLASELARLCDAPEERRRLSAAARNYCVGTFGREEVVSRLLEYYRLVHRAERTRPAAVAAGSPRRTDNADRPDGLADVSRP